MIIIIGAPGSGKTTQIEKIKLKLNYSTFCIGSVIREIINENNEKSQYLKQLINNGLLLENEEILNFIFEKINSNKIILDGFPRNIFQLQYLKNYIKRKEYKIEKIIYLNLPVNLIEKRLLLRKQNRLDDEIKIINKRIENYLIYNEELITILKNEYEFHEIDANLEEDKIFFKLMHLII